MSDPSRREKRKSRKPYVKPQVHRVELRPEEAVLGFCKSSNSAGPGVGSCTMSLWCSRSGS
jgi:hypothetical protein